jgi:hypothetical protein
MSVIEDLPVRVVFVEKPGPDPLFGRIEPLLWPKGTPQPDDPEALQPPKPDWIRRRELDLADLLRDLAENPWKEQPAEVQTGPLPPLPPEKPLEVTAGVRDGLFKVTIRGQLPLDDELLAQVEAAKTGNQAAARQAFADALGNLPEATPYLDAADRLARVESQHRNADALVKDIEARLADVELADSEVAKLVTHLAKARDTATALGLRLPGLKAAVVDARVAYEDAYRAVREQVKARLVEQAQAREDAALVVLRDQLGGLVAPVMGVQGLADFISDHAFWELGRVPLPQRAPTE